MQAAPCAAPRAAPPSRAPLAPPAPSSGRAAPRAAPHRKQQRAVQAAAQQERQDAGPSTSGGNGAAAANGAAPAAGFFAAGQEGASRQRLFNTIAPVYDELNDMLSLGLHRVWKRMAVKWSGAAPGARALDVCCGSGDLAFRLADAVGSQGSVVGLDFSANMLEDAARRTSGRRPPCGLEWVQGDAMQLPFGDASFDAATMGYGLRNVADIPAALRELHRVLRPGCSVAILDFNNASDNAAVDAVQAFALEQLVVPVARARGVAEEYEYLRPSIQRFPLGQQQEALARQAGFARAVHYPIGFGLMGCLVASKAP